LDAADREEMGAWVVSGLWVSWWWWWWWSGNLWARVLSSNRRRDLGDGLMVCECKSMFVLLEDVENVENRGSDDTDKNPEAEGEMGLYMSPFGMPFRTF
jgi:hypothetical protein